MRLILDVKNQFNSLFPDVPSPIALLMVIVSVSLAWYLVPHPLLAIVIGLAPFALLYVIKEPFLMVLLFVIFSFFRIHEVFPVLYPMKVPLMLSIASLLTLFWHLVLSQSIKLYWSPCLTVLSVFVGLVIIGVVLAENRSLAITFFKATYWKIILMTFAVTYLTRTPRDFSLCNLLIGVSGILVALVAISNKINGIGMVEGTRVTIGRAIGSMLGDPNDLALVLMFPASFALSMMITPGLPKLFRILGAIGMPLSFYAIIATQSRGGLLGMMAIVGVLVYRKMKSKTLFFSLATAGAVILYAVAGISDRASGGAAEEGIDASAMGRLYAWQAAYRMAFENPLTGVGINNFYANYYFYSDHWDGLNHAVHSTWFGVLAETGILGLLVFLAFIGLSIHTARETLDKIEANRDKLPAVFYSSAQALLAGFAGTIVSGTFLTQGFNWPIYLLAGLVVALAQATKLQLASLSKPG
ncbi:O-antigen ligase family protein [Shewanella submarina]|uniref:O-antigen ligase family protein n=1 Tax=Shewanella submarina TaxID=2016376 RepID=A0ABV7GGI0_9GAMM|nr:O-antigen ligase family protein [Shewanella submarina]MCL1038196.1 O-antigen ligase family protein [Shewanella submarina]